MIVGIMVNTSIFKKFTLFKINRLKINAAAMHKASGLVKTAKEIKIIEKNKLIVFSLSKYLKKKVMEKIILAHKKYTSEAFAFWNEKKPKNNIYKKILLLSLIFKFEIKKILDDKK